MHDKLTIFEQFNELEFQEQKRVEESIEQIKKIQACAPDLKVSLPRRPPPGAGNVAKVSPSGKLIGWYREGQKSGKPNKLMPIEQDLKLIYQQYKNSVIAAIPKSATATIIGVRSGKVRKERGLYEPILLLQQKLINEGIPKHHRAKLIAQTLDCSIEYLRRTLRQSNQKI
jgi:hypothetical protein